MIIFVHIRVLNLYRSDEKIEMLQVFTYMGCTEDQLRIPAKFIIPRYCNLLSGVIHTYILICFGFYPDIGF